MVYKNFKLNIILRLLLMAISIAALLYFVLITEQYLRSVYIFVFLIVLLVEFIYYVDKTNRDFTSFLLAILQNDFTTTFSEKSKGKSFEQLYSALNQITQKFKNISSEKEMQFLYLETLVEQIRVGVLSFDEKGDIHLINDAFKNIINRPHLKNVDALAKVDKNLLEVIRNIKPTENKLVKVSIDNKLSQLSINAAEFKLQSEYFKLVSLQNIKNELEAHELETWQKLIRVLTHEIMNSVTPITSLTATLQDIIQKEREELKTNGEDSLENIAEGLSAIKNRSEGLQTFTEAYKDLTRMPLPEFQKTDLSTVFGRIERLFQADASERDVVLTVNQNVDREVLIDPELFDQVLINLVKNAFEAVEEQELKRVYLSATEANQKITITVRDNGPGIEPDKLDKIFIPFFTTKKKGSGIGLAVSRQILQMHNGTINVDSEEEGGTTVTLVL